MKNVTSKPEPSHLAIESNSHLFDDWFDPIENMIRGQVRGLIEEMIRGELDATLSRPRYGRRGGHSEGRDSTTAVVTGHRHGSRVRTLTGTFGKTEIAVPRARLNISGGKTTEWKSQVLRNYQRRTRAADALIAGAYLSGTNTRRVRRALRSVFGGEVGKDTVSRVWRKVKGRRHRGARAARSQSHFHLAARRHRGARGRPKSAPGDQTDGRREHRGLAHSPRRSRQARPAAARAPHRRWRHGARERDRRRLGSRAGAEVHGAQA